MTETHFKAPSADENIAGPRAFAYVAEVDVMGWKFRVMYDGSLQIDLPTMPVDDLPVSPITLSGDGLGEADAEERPAAEETTAAAPAPGPRREARHRRKKKAK